MAADPEVNKSSEESSTMLLKISRKKRASSTSMDEDENSFEDNNNGESTGSSEAEEIRSKRTKTNNSGNKHPVYRGVRMRSWGKWVSEIREPKKKSRIWLGTYPTPEMAARAHDVAAMTIKGKSAFLNFPELASTLPRPASLSARDIQAAAAEAASAAAASLEPEEKTSEFLDQQENSSNVSNSSDVATSEWNSSSFDEKLIMDNDIFFNMPDFLNNMAEGLLVTPPWIINEDSCEYNFADVPLWSYSS